jgi:segregation and condensation protein A
MENSTQNFYSYKLEELDLKFPEDELEEKQQAIEAIKANIDDSSLELLVDLARQGELDPWDIDLEKVTSKYLYAISQNPSECLKEAGRAIFYASVLLRMKSDVLFAQSNEALNIGLHRELDDDYLLDEELISANIKQITFNDLEAAIRRKYIQKAKRFRKLTLQDLIAALQEAKEEEENRVHKKEMRLLDLEYSIIAPEVGDDMLELTHAEDLESVIRRLEIILPEYLCDGQGLEFKEIVRIVGCWSNAFLAILFLAHEHIIEFKQENFYGPLWIFSTKEEEDKK